MKNTKTGETKVVHEVIGPVETTYKFTGLCDFQYLPMVKNSETEGFDSIKEKIVLSRLPSTKGQLISKWPFAVSKVLNFYPPKSCFRIHFLEFSFSADISHFYVLIYNSET